MDVVLDALDHHLLTPYVYPPDWEPHSLSRQVISLLVILNLGGVILYLTLAALSYQFIFDHRLMKHPHFLQNQIQLEIRCALSSIPLMSLPTMVVFLLEIRGYSHLYDNISDHGWSTWLVSIPGFLFFTDMFIYFIHRGLHHKSVYRHVHKVHHTWKVPTPFASHAFHPADGFLQSCPYHVYPFLFPLHKLTYLVLFLLVNVWTVSIHDGDYRVPGALRPYINGSAHHTDHHLFYNYCYGQFFTFWDRVGGSYRQPSAFTREGPMDEMIKRGIVSKDQ